MKIISSSQKMGLAAVIMAASILISRFMGLFRDKIISWQFGISSEADIYFAAFVIPDFINYLLAGGYLSITLIPILSDLLHKDKEDAWKFFGTVFTLISTAIIFLTLLAFIFADELTHFVAPGFALAEHSRLVSFIRIILPAQVFFLCGATFTAILYIRNEFLIPALTPLIYNLSIILCGVLFPYLGLAEGMEGFCYGVLLGAFLGTFLLPLYAVRQGEFKFVLSFRHKYFKRFLLLALPLMIGQSVVVLDEQFVRIFGSLAEEGAVSLLNYARRIMLVPVGVVAQATALAAYPFLAALVAKGDTAKFNKSLQAALNNSLFLVIPITIYMILLAPQILGFIFEGGSFGVEETKLASPLLQLMLLAVPLWLVQQIIGRAFYAYQDTVSPAVLGTCTSLLMIPCYYYFTLQYGMIAVAALTSFSLLLYTALLVYFWQRKFGWQALEGVSSLFIKSLLLSAPSTLILYFGMDFLCEYLSFESLLLSQFYILTISAIIFFTLWLILSIIFIPTLLQANLNKISKKIFKKEIFKGNASN